MLFKDRLEIWNPGTLPLGWSVDKLKKRHPSIPANPLLAQPMYLAGYVERIGTGTADMVRISAQNGLKEPEFIQEDSFCTILYRPVMSTGEVTGEVTGGVTGGVKKLLKVLAGEMKRSEIQDALQLRHDDNFRTQYILPALEAKIIEMTFPQSPNHPNQKYRLTDNGRRLKQNMSNSDTICQQGHVYL